MATASPSPTDDQSESTVASGPQIPAIEEPIISASPAVPPVPPQQAAQVVQMLVQAGIMPGGSPNPETIKYLTDFLKHDSDNKLTAADKEGGRKLKVRITALLISGVLAVMLLGLPIIGLVQGQKEFVTSFLDHHMAYLIALATAFIGGIGARNLFK